jgi:hypothetical protein
MNPRPRDLTDRASMSRVSDEELLNAIKNGGASVGKSPAMMAFKDVLTDDDIRDLVAYYARPAVGSCLSIGLPDRRYDGCGGSGALSLRVPALSPQGFS